jgi:hypothetical protein
VNAKRGREQRYQGICPVSWWNVAGVIFASGIHFKFFDVATVAARYILKKSSKNFKAIQFDFLHYNTSSEFEREYFQRMNTLKRAGTHAWYVRWSTLENDLTSSTSRVSMMANFISLGRVCHEEVDVEDIMSIELVANGLWCWRY